MRSALWPRRSAARCGALGLRTCSEDLGIWPIGLLIGLRQEIRLHCPRRRRGVSDLAGLGARLVFPRATAGVRVRGWKFVASERGSGTQVRKQEAVQIEFLTPLAEVRWGTSPGPADRGRGWRNAQGPLRFRSRPPPRQHVGKDRRHASGAQPKRAQEAIVTLR